MVAVQPCGSRASALSLADSCAIRPYVVPPGGSSASMVNPVPVGHISTASTRSVIPQTRWTRSTHSAAIARRPADSSAATWRSAAAKASSSRASSWRSVECAVVPIPTPITAREPSAAQVSGPLVMAHVVQPAPTSHEAERMVMVRAERRSRRLLTVWPIA